IDISDDLDSMPDWQSRCNSPWQARGATRRGKGWAVDMWQWLRRCTIGVVIQVLLIGGVATAGLLAFCSVPDPREDRATLAQDNELGELHDGTLLPMSAPREVDIRRSEPQADPAAAVAYQLATGALAAAGLCVAGGVGLAR